MRWEPGDKVNRMAEVEERLRVRAGTHGTVACKKKAAWGRVNPKNRSFWTHAHLASAGPGSTGSHHILTHTSVPQPLNLQEVDGKAIPYQVRQFLRIMRR